MDQKIRTHSWGPANHTLVISDGTLTFGAHRISLASVTRLMYGAASIRFDMFHVGTRYVIDLKNEHDRIRIVFRSYFGVSKNYFEALYEKIIGDVWEAVFVRLMNEWMVCLQCGETIQVGHCDLSPAGLTFHGFLIRWSDLSYQRNYNKLTLNSKSNAAIWTNLFYLETYNADVLAIFLDEIFLSNGLERLNQTPL